MGLHKDLPIYKVAYDLLALAVELARSMKRDVKQQLGGKLRDECLEVAVLIYRANVARDKAPYLLALVERLQVAELLLRLSCDLRCISQGQYARAVELTTSIGKQATGWRKKSAAPAA